MIAQSRVEVVRARAHVFALILCTAYSLHAATAVAAPPAHVANGNDSGPGSLRAALASGANVITIGGSVPTINLESTLVYSGDHALRIVGSGQYIVADDDFTLLVVSEGADLSIANLSFQGVGGFSAESQGNGKGIFVDVPRERVGVVTLELSNVAVLDVANHGVHISDCDLDDACGSGSGGGGDGSNASIHAVFTNVVISGVGYGKFDADGLRIDDRGEGDIWFEAVGSSFLGVGADGVELDEGGSGDVIVDVRNSSFEANGGYCVVVEANPELDPSCFDDGELDLDDGFDVDEAGDGSIYAVVTNVWLDANLDEGLDFDEEGAGDLDIELTHVGADANGDEGVKVSEADDGDVAAQLRSVTAADNGDDGVQLEAEHAGQIAVTVNGSATTNNAKKGLNVAQNDENDLGTLKVRGSNITDGIKTSNVDEI